MHSFVPCFVTGRLLLVQTITRNFQKDQLMGVKTDFSEIVHVQGERIPLAPVVGKEYFW